MVYPRCIFIVGGSWCCKIVKPCPSRLFQVYSIAYICHNVSLKHSLVVHAHKVLLVLLRGRSNVNSIRDFVLLLLVVVPLLPDGNHVVQQRPPPQFIPVIGGRGISTCLRDVNATTASVQWWNLWGHEQDVQWDWLSLEILRGYNTPFWGYKWFSCSFVAEGWQRGIRCFVSGF